MDPEVVFILLLFVLVTIPILIGAVVLINRATGGDTEDEVEELEKNRISWPLRISTDPPMFETASGFRSPLLGHTNRSNPSDTLICTRDMLSE